MNYGSNANESLALEQESHRERPDAGFAVILCSCRVLYPHFVPPNMGAVELSGPSTMPIAVASKSTFVAPLLAHGPFFFIFFIFFS